MTVAERLWKEADMFFPKKLHPRAIDPLSKRRADLKRFHWLISSLVPFYSVAFSTVSVKYANRMVVGYLKWQQP